MFLSPFEFDFIQKLVRSRSAIVLEAGKEYLVESRLTPLMKIQSISGFDELIRTLKSFSNSDLERKVVEAMTTNETTFFRDTHPFDALKNQLFSEFQKNNGISKTLNIWSAAASTGQEAYTIAIIIQEYFPQLLNWNLKIIGTDLSRDVLEKARKGRYTQLEINRGLPAPLMVKYFTREGMDWCIKEDLKKMVEFRQMNLVEPWPILPAMDIVFLRNVLIYFDVEIKKSILTKMKKVLKPDGYLFLGGAETTLNIDDGFDRVQIDKASCYKLKPGM